MVKRSIKVNGFIVGTVVALMVVYYRDVIPVYSGGEIDHWVDLFGMLVIGMGELLRISARGYKSESLQADRVVVTSGPYAVVRNPMYLGSFLIGLGITVLLLNLWFVPAYVAFFMVWYGPQIYSEEHFLRLKYGQAYRLYCMVTPRMVPSLRGVWKQVASRQSVLPFKVGWIHNEIPTMSAICLGLLLAEGYEDISLYGLNSFLVEGGILAVLLAILWGYQLHVAMRRNAISR